jgi:hypothetical protein
MLELEDIIIHSKRILNLLYSLKCCSPSSFYTLQILLNLELLEFTLSALDMLGMWLSEEYFIIPETTQRCVLIGGS